MKHIRSRGDKCLFSILSLCYIKTMTVIEQKYTSVSLIKFAGIRTDHYTLKQVTLQPVVNVTVLSKRILFNDF